MYDFEALVAEVLRNKPDVTRESLTAMIQEKKRTVGSGYLTDQGALFLVAGELGVKLQHMVSTDLALKDLHVGANDVTLVARVLAIYPVSEFKRKDGTGVGRYRRVNLFDGSRVGRLTIWEDNEEAMKLDGVAVDSPVRVISAYVKAGLDGSPAINLGKRGKIELVTDDKVSSKIPSLSAVAKQSETIKEGEPVMAVDGLAATDSRTSTFTRRDDGSTGTLMQFELRCGEKNSRVVVWDGVNLPEVRSGAKVRITNLRQKKGRQGDSELHGDSASVIQLIGQSAPARHEPRFIKVKEIPKRGSVGGGVDLEVMALSKGGVREVNTKDGSTAKKGEVLLGDDTGEITAIAWDENSKVIGGIEAGERLRVYGLVVQVSKMGTETLEFGESSRLERMK
jgi:ssDNA-binding replication factor A large subunit